MAPPPGFHLLLLLLLVLLLPPGPAAGLQALGEAAEMAAGLRAGLPELELELELPGLELPELPELEPPELEPECRRLLAAFAEGSAALSGCLARRARPVRLCQACRGQYRSLLGRYRDIARALGVGPRGGGGWGWGGGNGTGGQRGQLPRTPSGGGLRVPACVRALARCRGVLG